MSKTEPVTNVVERESWGGRFEFLLSCIGYCVGLGNVWRFPYLAYENGGGVFFIPYFLMLFICGIPLFMAELAIGQYSGQGTLTVWKCLPAFKGIGYGMVMVSFLVYIYYNIVIAYSFHYLFSGFQKVLPWTRCDAWWNSANTKAECAILNSGELSEDQLNCRIANETNGLVSFWKSNQTLVDDWTSRFSNVTAYPDFGSLDYDSLFDPTKKTEPAEEYWFRRVLRLETDETDAGNELYTISNLGGVLWDLVGCNALTWVLLFLCMFRGVKSSGKVVYFTATFPYVVLIILVAFGATLDGALDGIRFYLKPDVSKLQDGQVWAAAATQIFYSLSVSFGGLMTMASYNEFQNNILRDTLIVTLGNCFSSVFAGFGVFSFLGHLAYRNCLDVDDVVKAGPGLSFIAYPEAIGLLPVCQLFSALFFIMMVLLGVDSQFAHCDVPIQAFLDEYPNLLPKKFARAIVVGVACLVGFLIGIPILTNGGYHVFRFFDDYVALYGLLLLALTFTIAVNYIYQFMTVKFRFFGDIEKMIGRMNIVAKVYFSLMWFVGSPVMILFIVINAFIGYKPLADRYFDTYGEDAYLIYPPWSNGLANTVAFLAFIPIPIYFVYALAKWGNQSFYPTADWGAREKIQSESLHKENPAFDDHTGESNDL